MSNVLKMLSRGGAVAAETDPNFKQTVLLLHGDGTNGAQNNTFLDSSTNNFTITRNGNTTQGTFSPFSLAAGEWSNYFDGNGDRLSVTNNAALNFNADFTFECWIYPTANPSGASLFEGYQSGFGIGFNVNTLQVAQSYVAVLLSDTTAITLNTWTHIAVSRSGTTLSLFRNGARVATTTNSTSFSTNSTNYIGFNGGSAYFTGYIANLRAVKGSAVYDPSQTTLTVPTTPLTAITNTSLLTCQSNRFVDNSTNAFAITRNGDVRVTPFSPFAPTAAYSAGTNGGSGYFDGNSDYLTAASNAAFAFGTGDFTIEAWINPASLAADTLLCGVDVTNGAILGYSTSTVWLGSRGIAYDLTATYTLPLNSWTHIAVSRQGTTARLFANGVQIASGTVTKNYPQGVFTVGNYTAVNIGVNGYLFNVRAVKGTAVYTGAFTPPTLPLSTSGAASASAYPSTTNINTTFASSETSLLLNFTNAGIIDNTGKNNLETVGNAQIDTTTKKYGTGSLEFDGTGDYLTVPFSPDFGFGTGDYTIEFWLNTASTTRYDTPLARWTATNNDAYLFFLNQGGVGSGKISFWVGAVSSGAAFLESTTSVNNSTWHHICVCRASGTTRLFINGTSEASSTTSYNITNSSGNALWIGTDPLNPTTRDFAGYIDDLRITKGVARYTANFTPPTKEFPDL